MPNRIGENKVQPDISIYIGHGIEIRYAAYAFPVGEKILAVGLSELFYVVVWDNF